jgi:signal transduction histidine kinase
MKEPSGITPAAGSVSALFPGNSAHASLCRRLDWSATPLGAVESWPASLRLMTATALAAPVPMAILWGPEFLQIYNEAMQGLFGHRHPAALGRPVRESWSEVWDDMSPIYERIMAGGGAEVMEDRHFRVIRHDSLQDEWYTATYSPLLDDDASVGGVLVIARETTQHHRDAAELTRAHSFLHGIAQGTGDLIAALDPEYRFTFANEAYRREFRRLWGSDPHPGTSLLDALAPWPDQQRNARDLWARALAGEAFQVTMAFGPEPAERQHYDLRFNPINADGALIGAAHILRNVTDQVAVRQTLELRERAARDLARELARERRKLAAVIENLPVGIGIVDAASGDVLSMNPAARAVHGYPPDSGLPAQPADYFRQFQLLHLDGTPVPAEEWPVTRARQGEYVQDFRVRLLNREGGPQQVVGFDVVPVQDESGTPILFVIVMEELTSAQRVAEEREQLLDAERSAREAAERSSTVKTQFLSVISHELRTPLTAVLGYADLLEAEVPGPMNQRQREYLSRIRASTAHLVMIIDEILSFARAEAGREEVRLGKEDVAAVVRGVVGMLAGEARTRSLELTLDGAQHPVVAFTDGGKVNQILINLVGNALKYTEQGSVHVQLKASPGEVEISVSDTGPGVPADRLEEIFEPFVQLDQSNTRTRGGTGLGLAICRRLARLLGGEVSVVSQPGEGSTFTCRLPRGR